MRKEFKFRKIVYEGEEYSNYKFDFWENQVFSLYKKVYLKFNINPGGYYIVGLHKDNKVNFIFFHRLVYQMHNPNVDIKDKKIYHKNRDIKDNRIENLRLATLP